MKSIQNFIDQSLELKYIQGGDKLIGTTVCADTGNTMELYQRTFLGIKTGIYTINKCCDNTGKVTAENFISTSSFE